jgi:hypothetical protein
MDFSLMAAPKNLRLLAIGSESEAQSASRQYQTCRAFVERPRIVMGVFSIDRFEQMAHR